MPPLQHSAFGAAVLENEFEALVRLGKNGVMEPHAAASWEVRPDHRLVRFKIDTQRRFSDGSRLTATDFKRAWEDGLRMKEKSKNKSVLDLLYTVKGFSSFSKTGSLDGVRVISDDVLEVELEKPTRLAVEYLSGTRYAAYKEVGGKPIGTGPYVMRELGDQLELTPNVHYIGNEPRFETVKIVVTDPSKVRERLESGDLDAAIFAERTDLASCKEPSKTGVKCVFSQESDHVAIYMNGLQGRFFSQPEHRRALQTLIHDRLKRTGVPSELQKSSFDHDPQSFLHFQPGRLSEPEASELVAAGRSAIPALKAAAATKPLAVFCSRDCGWLLTLLREEGIPVTPESGKLEFSRVLNMIYNDHQADLIFAGFSVYNGDPDGLYHLLGRQGAISSPMMERPKVSDLMESGRAIIDRNGLAPHYQQVARSILTDVPYIHLGFSGRGVAFNSEKADVSETFLNRGNQRITLFIPR